MNKSGLPTRPFDGQEFVDRFNVRWVFDSSSQCWKRSGSVPDVPNANLTSIGLLSKEDKKLLDSLREKAGGYGFVIDPKFSVRTKGNPGNVIDGYVKIISESLIFECIDPEGRIIPKGCNFVPYSAEYHENFPGFDVSFSDSFLDSFCVEIPGGPGPIGKKGEKGEKGRDGTGDGPVGEQGDPGEDAVEPATFTGIKIEDVNEVYDTAVVDLELDNDNATLKVLKSKMQLPNSNTPAEKLITTPIYRNIEFGDDWDYKILRNSNDNESIHDDVLLGYYPSDVEFADIKETGSNLTSDIDETQITVRRLSEFVNSLISRYQNRLDEIADEYDEEIEKYIKELDDDARQKLDILAEELANSEFQRPLEYCIGLSPKDCQNVNLNVGTGGGGGDPGEICQVAENIAAEVIPQAGIECEDQLGEDLSIMELKANESRFVRYPTQVGGAKDLPTGVYVILYEGGSYFDADEPNKGYHIDIKSEAEEPTGAKSETFFPTPDPEVYDRFSEGALDDFLLTLELKLRTLVVSLLPDGGTIKFTGPQGNFTGTVKLRVVRCKACTEESSL